MSRRLSASSRRRTTIRLSDVKADLKTRKDQRAFDTIRGYVAAAEGTARVGTLYAPSQLTYHDADTVLKHVLADSVAARQTRRAARQRAAGFSHLADRAHRVKP